MLVADWRFWLPTGRTRSSSYRNTPTMDCSAHCRNWNSIYSVRIGRMWWPENLAGPFQYPAWLFSGLPLKKRWTLFGLKVNRRIHASITSGSTIMKELWQRKPYAKRKMKPKSPKGLNIYFLKHSVLLIHCINLPYTFGYPQIVWITILWW